VSANANGQRIARAVDDDVSFNESLANARLIAAAPELLKALKLVASPPNDEEAGYNAAQLKGLLALFRNEARAAIKAAKKS
jgi:hypothetical protein